MSAPDDELPDDVVFTMPPVSRFTIEAWPAGTRRRALRHALRYRAWHREAEEATQEYRACLLASAARVAELETTIRKARQRLYDAHGSTPEKVAQVIRAVGMILREQPAIPALLCPACGQAAPPDALRVVDGPRAGLACPGCAEALRRQGWAVVRRGRGGEVTR